MRSIRMLQVGLGLVALYAVAYLSSDSLMAPVADAQLVRAARAEASASALRIASEWNARREALRNVVRIAAVTAPIRDLGDSVSRNRRTESLTRAAAAVAVMSGSGAEVTILDARGDPVIDGESAPELPSSRAAQAALQGRVATIVQRLGDQVQMVAAAPIGEREIIGAVVLSIALRADNQAALMQNVPSGASIAVRYEGKPIFGTVSEEMSERVSTLGDDGIVELSGAEYRVASLPLEHDGRGPLSVVAIAALEVPTALSVTAHFKLLLILLGVCSVLVAVAAVALGASPGSPVRPPIPAKPAFEPTPDLPPVPDPDPRDADYEAAPARASGLNLNFDARPPEPEPHRDVGLDPHPPPYEPPYDAHSNHGYAAASAEPASVGSTFDAAFSSAPPPTPSAYNPADDVFADDPDDDESLDETMQGSMSSTSYHLQGDGAGEAIALPARMPPSVDPAEFVSGDLLQPAAFASPAQSEVSPSGAELAEPNDMEPARRASGTGFERETPPSHPAPRDPPLAPSIVGDEGFDDRFEPLPERGTPSPFTPPETGGNFREPTPFNDLAKAAFAAPPPKPEVEQRTDLPTPKGPVPPEIQAAQRAEAQRRGAVDSFGASPSASGSAYGDSDLPMPKDVPMPLEPLPPAASYEQPSRAVPSSRRPAILSDDLGGPEIPNSPVALPGAATDDQPRSERDPWRNPSVPKMKAVQPPSGVGPAPQPPVLGPAPFDEVHYRSVYQEFVRSKVELGESVENLSYDGFRTKLRNSEESLLDRHGCRAVRFQVLVKDRTVSLRPQLVR